MAIHFRRALCAGIAALFALHFRPGADIPQVKVTVNDKQCEPMTSR
jgi:iron uptake system component EfeO